MPSITAQEGEIESPETPTGEDGNTLFDIKRKVQNRYKVILEESWKHERPEVRNPDRRWYEIIPCQGFKKPPEQEGPFICLYSEDPPTLQLYTNRPINAKTIWKEIKKYPGTRADFHMDGEAVLFFPPSRLEMVATLAGGRKRRQLSEVQKEAMARGRVKAGLVRDEKGRIVHSQAQNSTQNGAIPTQARGLKAKVREMPRIQ